MRAALVVEAAMIAVSPLHECLDSLKYREAPVLGHRGSTREI